MGEQPSTNGLWLQGVTSTPGQTAYGVTLLCCFLSSERKDSETQLEEKLSVQLRQKETT